MRVAELLERRREAKLTDDESSELDGSPGEIPVCRGLVDYRGPGEGARRGSGDPPHKLKSV
jgi:hypothetical protein